MNISLNANCPCGSGFKYAACCFGKVDWEYVLTYAPDTCAHYLSLRGKNILFVESILAATQIENVPHNLDFSKFKRAFTPKAVRQINEAIIDIWPSSSDCKRILSDQRNQVTALYTGSYEPDDIFKAVTRHSLYNERILLSDPFLYPLYIKDEYSPLLHPEMHISNTIKWSYLWLSLAPLIEDGIINFIRTPEDMDLNEKHEILEIQREKMQCTPELQQVTEKHVQETVNNMTLLNKGVKEFMFLSQPNKVLLEMFHSTAGSCSIMSEGEFLNFINERRKTHPFYTDHHKKKGSQFICESSGLCYEAAKRCCAKTNSHIVTTLPTRWKEVELDHEHATGSTGIWSPFAKALQGSDLKILDNVPIHAVLKLRREKRLEPMRNFFSRVWRSCRDSESFSESNAQNLTSELDDRIAEARSEWSDIDKDLVKWIGVSGSLLLSSGFVGFVPAASATVFAGLTSLALSQWQRLSFKNRFPAAFFLGIKAQR